MEVAHKEFIDRDDNDMDGLLKMESRGYMGDDSALEAEIMPQSDELGYDGDWSNWISHEGAEPGVHLSHQQYIREQGPHTRGVSNQSIMDHVTDSNFRGMDRPPQPHRVKVHSGVREVQGDYEHQHHKVGINRYNCDVDGYFSKIKHQ
jgi:hypothetical protein